MKKNLKNLFTEDVQKILTDDTLTAIEEAIENRTTLAVDAALAEQDDVYAEKLKTLVESIDADRTRKMKKLMESLDKDRSAKLVKVIKKYEREQNTDMVKFKKELLESVGVFLDEFINETISKEDLAQAVKNKTAYTMLSNLRNVLSIDSATMNESVAGPILKAKEEHDAVLAENAKLKENLKLLREQKEDALKGLFLENKTAKFPETKRNFIRKALGDKSLKFIQENLEYTVRLFDKQEKKQLQTLKEDAIQGRKEKPDYVKTEKVITEKVNKKEDAYDPYVAEMEKMRF